MKIDQSLTDLLEILINNRDEIKNFDSVIEQNSCWKRHLYLGDIDATVGDSIENFIRFWNQMDDELNLPVEDRKPIKIFINSCGGDLDATFQMADAIKMSKTPVWTINTGTAYSGGLLVFITGVKRIAYPHSTFLYHEGATGMAGDAGKFHNYADFYKKQMEMIKELVMQNTQITEEQYQEHIKDDWWFTAKEAIEVGICDTITDHFVQ
jgi:ATP-dependent Clp protease protease subunit